MNLTKRSALIGDFYEKCGGTAKLSKMAKLTMGSLRVCKHRGVLSKTNKFELMEVANKCGFTLPSEIFEAITPKKEPIP